MNYTDRIYGKSTITEPVILELINSEPLQRLKGVDQAGYFEPYFPGTALSRFEHSVGVYLLLKKYGASIEEQIAGLIHDVSHSAFSHCIDYVFSAGSEKKQNYQDNIFAEFVKKSSIPSVLKKFQFDLDFILNDQNFPLQETELPSLCADRIDYSLREAFATKEFTNTNYFLKNLLTKNNRWIFKNLESAEKYAELFLLLNKKYYAGLESATMFQTVGDCLRHALKKKYFTKKDLYTTDALVLSKIHQHLATDPQLYLLFARMNNQIKFKNDPHDFTSTVFCKSRVVDPLCFHQTKIQRLSQIKPRWKKRIKEESKPKQYFLKFR
jgi:HD superfamily phosphohydrolase